MTPEMAEVLVNRRVNFGPGGNKKAQDPVFFCEMTVIIFQFALVVFDVFKDVDADDGVPIFAAVQIVNGSVNDGVAGNSSRLLFE